jgi:glyoxylase-like metal-dependent hydrolase (beta-lactamase superfamily II)
MDTKRPLVETRQLGRFRIHALNGGYQLLDGGAMFGVVPKPLWQKRIPADDRNRIPLALRCLLVETPDALVLIDNGAGNKESAKFIDIYGLDNRSSDPARWPTRLEESLAAAGFAADDVDVKIDSHLHFDHAGGNTCIEGGGGGEGGGGVGRGVSDARDARAATASSSFRLSFQRARYVAQRGEFVWAHSRNERIQASYLGHNFDPVMESGRLELVDGEPEIVPGIRMLRTPGHTPNHTSILVQSEDESACFLADLIPTTAHLPLPWIMGYDVEPLVTLETKRSLLARARREQWLLVFEHDPVVGWGRLSPDDERPVLVND